MCDQSHLIRLLRRNMGLTPRGFVGLASRELNAAESRPVPNWIPLSDEERHASTSDLPAVTNSGQEPSVGR